MKEFQKKHIILIFIVIIVLLNSCIGFVSFEPGGTRYSIRDENFVRFSNQKERDAELEALFDAAIEKYGGSGKYIIDYMKRIADTYCNSPYIAYYTWISNDTREKKGKNDFMFSLVSDVDTGIHETAHQFCSSAAYIDSEYTTSVKGYLSYSAPSQITSVYLEDWGVHHVLHTPSVPANVISDAIRNKGIMEDNRYTTYINSSSPYQSTQTEGIYGLLDEYHAYYYSLIAAVNRAIDTTLDSSYEEDGITYSISSFNDIYLSFLQFSTYIFTYIRMVELEHPQVYKTIMENRLLLEAIIRIHDAFHSKYNRFVEILNSEINTMGRDPFEDEHTLLKAEYELPENKQVLEKLRKSMEGG